MVTFVVALKIKHAIIGLFVLVSILLPEFLLLRLYFQRQTAMEVAVEVVRDKKLVDTFRLLKISQQDKQDIGNGFFQLKKHEFVWQGMMYDIVSELSVGDYTWYLVYPDRKETETVAHIRKINEYKHEKQANDKTKVESITFFNWFVADLAYFDELPLVFVRKPYVAQSHLLVERALDSIKKPPKM